MTKKAEAFFKRHMFAASLLIALIAAMLYDRKFDKLFQRQGAYVPCRFCVVLFGFCQYFYCNLHTQLESVL